MAFSRRPGKHDPIFAETKLAADPATLRYGILSDYAPNCNVRVEQCPVGQGCEIYTPSLALGPQCRSARETVYPTVSHGQAAQAIAERLRRRYGKPTIAQIETALQTTDEFRRSQSLRAAGAKARPSYDPASPRTIRNVVQQFYPGTEYTPPELGVFSPRYQSMMRSMSPLPSSSSVSSSPSPTPSVMSARPSMFLAAPTARYASGGMSPASTRPLTSGMAGAGAETKRAYAPTGAAAAAPSQTFDAGRVSVPAYNPRTSLTSSSVSSSFGATAPSSYSSTYRPPTAAAAPTATAPAGAAARTSAVPPETLALIDRLVRENPTWTNLQIAAEINRLQSTGRYDSFDYYDQYDHC